LSLSLLSPAQHTRCHKCVKVCHLPVVVVVVVGLRVLAAYNSAAESLHAFCSSLDSFFHN